ncbi:MAG: hypothetical protein Q9M26_08910 [Mariprofundales bacterium]|nr:hypothetical protein [Mariprofundales bacterium]
MTQNLFGWSSQIWLYLDQSGIMVGDGLMLLTFAGGVYSWLKRKDIRHWLYRNRFPDVGGRFDDDATNWDGIVFTVSRVEVPEWVMKQCQPSMIALVETEQSKTAAEKIADQAASLNIAVSSRHQVTDPDDPQQTCHAVAAALKGMRDRGLQRLAVDVTGGKTPMSLGAFMAAEEQGADTLYVASAFDAKLMKPDMTTASIRRISEVS